MVWPDIRNGRHGFHKHGRAAVVSQLLHRFVQGVERRGGGNCDSDSQCYEFCDGIWVRFQISAFGSLQTYIALSSLKENL